MTKRRKKGIYNFLITFPDRLYPFATQIEGQWVRGQRSYDRARARTFKRLGHGHYGFRLGIYRSIFHIMGSVFVITFAAFISQDVFGTKAALYIVLVIMVLYITFQELYLQRSIQCRRKAIADLFAWVAPIGIYLFFR